MTNGERYKTAEERKEAFDIFCEKQGKCPRCKFNDNKGVVSCCLHWLDDEYKEDLPFEIIRGEFFNICRADTKDTVFTETQSSSADRKCNDLNDAALAWHKRMCEKGG